MAPIRLTQLVKKGGCAAKVSASVLREILKNVEFPPKRSNVLVDGSGFDDAAIIDLGDGRALVQTLDFFTPIVDSPRLFGRIAATNALSDVYAMGGIPDNCMAILTFPQATLEAAVVQEIIQGACEIIAQAGASLVGGHSVDDETIKFGLSVSGFVPTNRIWANSGAKVGDILILTKPLGTGTLTAGLKQGSYTEAEIADAISSMSTLNQVVTFLNDQQRAAVHAATDITGFGLAGHSMQLAQSSGVQLSISTKQLPLFSKTRESLSAGHLTRAHTSNRQYTELHIDTASLSDQDRLVVVDPQTSGGLLLAVDPEVSDSLLATLLPHFPATCQIGQVTTRQSFDVSFN